MKNTKPQSSHLNDSYPSGICPPSQYISIKFADGNCAEVTVALYSTDEQGTGQAHRSDMFSTWK